MHVLRKLLFVKNVKKVAYMLTKLKAIMNKRVARKTLEAKKQTFEKTNDGPCSNVISYEKILAGPWKNLFESR